MPGQARPWRSLGVTAAPEGRRAGVNLTESFWGFSCARYAEPRRAGGCDARDEGTKQADPVANDVRACSTLDARRLTSHKRFGGWSNDIRHPPDANGFPDMGGRARAWKGPPGACMPPALPSAALRAGRAPEARRHHSAARCTALSSALRALRTAPSHHAHRSPLMLTERSASRRRAEQPR